MTETHATVRAVFRMWTGASETATRILKLEPSMRACSLAPMGSDEQRVSEQDVRGDALLSLPLCPVCGVLLTMAEENRRTE